MVPGLVYLKNKRDILHKYFFKFANFQSDVQKNNLTAQLNHLKKRKNHPEPKNENTSRFGTVGYTQPNDSLLFRVQKKNKKKIGESSTA